MKLLRGIGKFCYDFIIGDDWKIAAGVVVALLLTGVVLATGVFSESGVAIFGAIAIVVAFVCSLLIDVRR